MFSKRLRSRRLVTLAVCLGAIAAASGRLVAGSLELQPGDRISIVGNTPFIFSSDFPHEVNNDTCKAELEELDENKRLTQDDKEAVRFRNAERFYGLTAN